ncbi:MAG: ankyrin repeat domain-containing protein [Candidatus Paceibacterota bacterium]|jgi:hypothetical protein
MTDTCTCSKLTPATQILLSASRAGLSKIIIAALEEGADIEARDHSDYNALASATFFGHYHAVRILVAFGADPHELIQKGATLLIVAAIGGHADIGEYLISLGVPIDVVDGDGDSAMSVAKKFGHEKFITMLEKYRK